MMGMIQRFWLPNAISKGKIVCAIIARFLRPEDFGSGLGSRSGDARSTGWGTALCLTLILSVLSMIPNLAQACGAMMFQSDPAGTAHMTQWKIFLGFGPSRTTLVLSTEYQGSGAEGGEAAFIVPLAAVPELIQQAPKKFFRALDHRTAPLFYINDVSDKQNKDQPAGCANSRSSKKGVANGDEGVREDIEILLQGQTEDYDYVVVGGSSGQSLEAWLGTHGYSVTPGFAAVAAPYLEQNWSFLAARVRSSDVVRELAPLEIQFTPFDPAQTMLPLAIAADSFRDEQQLGVVLYVAAPEGMGLKNYPTVEIPVQDIYAKSPSQSNYRDLYADALASDANGAWVIEYRNLSWESDQAPSLGDLQDPDFEEDISELLRFSEAHGLNGTQLSRLRTHLDGPRLRDIQLELRPGEHINLRGRSLQFTGDSQCQIGGPVGLFGLSWLAGLLWLRRRPAH